MKIKAFLFLINFILLWMISCDNQESPSNKEFVFQGKYDSSNKNDVIKNIKENYIKNKKDKFESNYGIEQFVAYDFKTEEIDTADVLTNIKLILGNQKFLLGNIIPDSIKGGQLEKALKAHDDSLIYFYTYFHGYRISYYYYLTYEDKNKSPHVYYHVLWVDTNSNVILESMPYALNIIFEDEQPFARHEQRKMFVKKYWSDSLPKDIDSSQITKYYQHKNGH